jgi:hypothetical protein
MLTGVSDIPYHKNALRCFLDATNEQMYRERDKQTDIHRDENKRIFATFLCECNKNASRSECIQFVICSGSE